MKDGSGNHVVQRNKSIVQPDAAATEWKLGHAKKSNDDSKGLVYLCCKENYSISLRLCLLFDGIL
jgi:hypothetical protein